MRILVDTTVWLELFRAEETMQAQRLREAVDRRDELCTAGVILGEVLAGIEDVLLWAWVRRVLSSLTFLEASRATHLCAVHCALQARGLGVRAGPRDALVVALAKHHGARLLHDDPLLAAIHRAIGFPSVDALAPAMDTGRRR